MIELDVSILVSGESKNRRRTSYGKNGFIMYWKAQKTKKIVKKFFDTSKYKSYLVSNNEKSQI